MTKKGMGMRKKIVMLGVISIMVLTISVSCFSQELQASFKNDGAEKAPAFWEWVTIWDDCINCGVCVSAAPAIFKESDDGEHVEFWDDGMGCILGWSCSTIAHVSNWFQCGDMLDDAIASCPVEAIRSISDPIEGFCWLSEGEPELPFVNASVQAATWGAIKSIYR